jgi:hypothetical protein
MRRILAETKGNTSTATTIMREASTASEVTETRTGF